MVLWPPLWRIVVSTPADPSKNKGCCVTARPCFARIGRVASMIASSGAYLDLKYGLDAVLGTLDSSPIAATRASEYCVCAFVSMCVVCCVLLLFLNLRFFVD